MFTHDLSRHILMLTYVLILRSQTSTAPSLTHANTVEDLGDHVTSYTDFYDKDKHSKSW